MIKGILKKTEINEPSDSRLSRLSKSPKKKVTVVESPSKEFRSP